jgi:uncharacterized protein HemX
LNLKIKLLISALSAVLALGACSQAEVVADKVMAKINEKIGKHEVQLKEAEKQLKRLKEARRKAEISARQSTKSIESKQSDVTQAQAAVDELKSK